MEKIKYVLMSKGFTLKDFDEETVVNKLAIAMTTTPERVKNKLLSGTPKRIKGNESLATIQKLEKKLLVLGLDVFIEERSGRSSNQSIEGTNDKKMTLTRAIVTTRRISSTKSFDCINLYSGYSAY